MKVFSLITLLGVCNLVTGLGQNVTVTTSSASGLLQLAGGGKDNQILLSADDWWGVLRAAEDLAGDFGKVVGKNLTLANWQGGKTTASYSYKPVTSFVNYTVGAAEQFTGATLQSSTLSKCVIIAGTIGKSSVINALISSGKLDASPITGKWESFISQVINSPLPGVDKALVIAGSDLRGTIFGLYDISEQIGVSPWWWWADVPIKRMAGVWALGVKKVQGSPSVKYRGIFINDEQPALTNWINMNYAPGKYGPGFNHFFYPHVFELLLRLRANYLWPAMWASMFNVDDTANQPLADAFGIVMGTSHTEPMMRATNEWGSFGKGSWSYNVNNASINPFFTYGAQRAKPYAASSLFTMAMRGSGDTGITLSDPEAVVVLENVIKSQREILSSVFNGTNVTDIPQMWCLYKEVQGYYENLGLTVPDDVTLLWTDDNWGNIRRLPLANEMGRSGGAGVYYHVDYVGDPRSYKWINTIQLSKTVEQMQLALARQADRIWILNVGDLKPLEVPINHFLDMAYDTPKWGYNSAPTWLKLWAIREFDVTEARAAAIVSVLDRYGMYAARRKYELIDPSVYSIINYNEGEAVLAQWAKLAVDAQAIYDNLGSEYKAAYYEMILQPVLGGEVVNQIYIGAAKNSLYSLQKRNSANSVAMDVLADFKQDHVLTQRYHDLLGGKWNHMLDQTHLGYWGYWQQPMRNMAPPLTFVQEFETALPGNIGIGVEASNATVSGDDSYHSNSGATLVLPPMDPYGPKTRYIDVFARGTSGCQWTLTPAASYVALSQTTGYTGGHNGTDTRVFVSIDWTKAPTAPNSTTVTISVLSSCGSWGPYPKPTIQVPVISRSIPANTAGFVESDGVIAIEAAHASRNSSVGGVHYLTLDSYGRTKSGVTMLPVLAPTQPAGTGPVLEYDIFTFTASTVVNITLLLSPSLNHKGSAQPLKYAIAIDDQAPKTIQFVGNYTGTNMPAGWGGAVSDAVWGLTASGKTTTTKHDLGTAGSHTLKIWLVETGVVIQKIMLDFGGLRPSYLGPPESFLAGRDTVGKYEGLNFGDVK